MLPKARLQLISQLAMKENTIYVSELSKKLNVSKETIRKDLDKLAEQDIIIRSYGGAVRNTKKLINKPLYNTEKENIENNGEYIARKAVEFIKEGSTIFASSGSMSLQVLRNIKNKKNITVVTNSIIILNEFCQSELNIISTGGSVNSKLLSFEGPITQDSIKKYNVDIALIDCKGIDIRKGILDSDETAVEIKKTMIKQADKVILLAEHTKFDKISLIKLASYDDIDCIVTDKEPKKDWINLLNSHKVESIY